MASPKQQFLNWAKYWAVTNVARESGGQNKFKKGSELAKIFSLAGASAGTAWCAIFVYACAKKAGIAGKLLTNKRYAPSICHSVVSKGGQWIKGPYVTKTAVKPKPGDLILFNSKKCHMSYKTDGTVKAWHGTHVGIVYKVTSHSVITMEGNVKGGRAKKITRTLSNKSIAGYARPKWSKVGDSDDGGDGDTGPLYQTENDRHDMTMREIGYMNANGKLTTSDTGVHIGLINYTTLLGDLYDQFERNIYGGDLVNTAKLKGNEKIVVDYFINQGINAAGACGIAANIKVDSNYNPATQSGVEYGICKWSGTKAGQMRDSAGMTSWATNLSGQLDFLMADLEGNYSSLLTKLKKATKSEAGAAKAASEFSKTYRKITSTSVRETDAKAIYSSIKYTPPISTGTTKKPTNATGDACTIIDMAGKTQKSLASCCRSFEVGMADSGIITEWQEKGKSMSKGLVYLNNCYVVAYNTKTLSLNVNDYIEIITTKGKTISCIVAGGFGENDTQIKFYRYNNTKTNMSEWSGVKIKQIKNYGKRA